MHEEVRMVRTLVAAGLVLTAAFAPARAQSPMNGSQWAPIPETMHDLIAGGYTLTTVDGQSLEDGGVATIFYLSRPKDLVRCSESSGVGGQTPMVFPCEKLVATRKSK